MNFYSGNSILFYPITLEDRRGTTDEFATTPFHLDLFSAALVELAKSIPVHSLILSSHLFFCLPLFLFPFTVPCRIVFAKPEDLETWPNHLSFRFLTRYVAVVDINSLERDGLRQAELCPRHIAVRQEVNNLVSSVVVQALELAINLSLYGRL